MSPAGTLCFDIFSPPSGDSDVISQVERLSSNEMNIAPRSLRIAFGASGRSATVCMVVSRVGDRNLTLPERRSLSTSPWDLEAEIVALRHQLNVLRRKSPKRPAFSNLDRLIFACLYRISPRIVNVLVIVKPETVIRWHGAGFRFFWRWKSRSRGGRPQVPLEIRQLIREMSLANPLWGAPLNAMGIRDRPTAPRSPWQNGHTERLIGSIRRECLDHVVVFGERHLRHLLLILYGILQWRENTPFAEQGCAGTTGCSGHRAHSSDTNSRRVTPSVCSDLISDRDNRQSWTISRQEPRGTHAVAAAKH